MTSSSTAPLMKVGTVVIYLAEKERASNGTREHSAIVTRVWGDGPHPTVNTKVLPDCGEPFDATSVQHWSEGPFPTDGQFSYRYKLASE